MNDACLKKSPISEEEERRIDEFAINIFVSLDGTPPHFRREILKRATQMTEKAYREKVYNSQEELKQNEIMLATFLGEM